MSDRVVGHPDAAHADSANAAEGLSDRVVGHPDAGHADSAIAAVGATHDGDDSGDGGLRAKLKDECKHATDCIRLSI